MIDIVTGKRGYPHVTSYQMQAFNRGVLGDFALIGNNHKMQAQKINNNRVRILDGCVVFQGVYAIIEHGNYEDITIENIEVGYRRIDTIYLHYVKNANTVLESVSIDVEKGQTVQSNPVPPTFPDADRWEDDIDVKIPMYDVLVTMDGITITPYERMTNEYPSLNDLSKSDVTKDYVEKMILDLKRESAKASNDKFDESAIPSQYVNKLYVYGNPESMYPASDIGGEMPEITHGHIEVGYNYWGQLVPNWEMQDNRIYDDEYNRLCAIKVIDQQDANWAYWFALCFKSDESIIANPTYDNNPGESIRHGGLTSKQYIRGYAQPSEPQEWVETSVINYISGGSIRDTTTEQGQYYGCQVSGIPIFVVNNNSQAEWDKVNHYIATGDYSNAINYNELYPDNPKSFVAIDVISGDWYTVVNNAWVKQGTLDLSSSGGSDMYRVMFYDRDTFLNREYVRKNDDALYSYKRDSWSLTDGGEPVVDIKNNITQDLDLYYVMPEGLYIVDGNWQIDNAEKQEYTPGCIVVDVQSDLVKVTSANMTNGAYGAQVDVTDWNYAVLELDYCTAAYSYFGIGMNFSYDSMGNQIAKAGLSNKSTPYRWVVDISNYSGLYYCFVSCGGNARFDIKKMFLTNKEYTSGDIN